MRVLEDHDGMAAGAAEPGAAEMRDVGTTEADVPRGGAREPQGCQGQRCLARAGLADDADDLALGNLQADTVNGLDTTPRADRHRDLTAVGEEDTEVFDLQQRSRGLHRLRRGLAHGEATGSWP